jgi:ATP-binding cassette subfamily B protein
MNISLRQYYDILARYLRPQKLRFALLALLVFTSIGMQVVNPQIMRRFIDDATNGKPLDVLLFSALAFVGIALCQQILSVSAAYVGEYVAWIATNGLREDLAKHCLYLDMQFHHEKSPGEFIERIEGDSLEFANFFSQMVLRVAGNILLLTGILIAMFRVDAKLGFFFTVFAIITLIGLNMVRGIAIPFQKAHRDAATDFFGFLEERLSGTEDIRSSGAVDYVLCKLFELMAKIYRLWRKSSITQIYVRVTAGLLLTCGIGVAFVLGSQLFHDKIITIGVLYMVIHYTGLISQPIRELTQQVESLQNIGATVERMGELLRQNSTITEGKGADWAVGEPLEIAFNDISFAYHEDKPVLKKLSFKVEPGKVLGLLGRTGSGKTTIARLIFRLYEAQSGDILLNGDSIKCAKLDELRHRVAFVTQDVQLFQASVRDNITFFNKDIPDETIIDVINKLELADWFESLPEGLNTRLQTGGRSLSAGEAQLLAFTRVFLRNPGLVILDEASSRLDPATEQMVERAINHLLENRTAIIVAHRLGTLKRADDVLVLEHGEIGEYGNRIKLLADEKSHFYALHQTGLEEVMV